MLVNFEKGYLHHNWVHSTPCLPHLNSPGHHHQGRLENVNMKKVSPICFTFYHIYIKSCLTSATALRSPVLPQTAASTLFWISKLELPAANSRTPANSLDDGVMLFMVLLSSSFCLLPIMISENHCRKKQYIRWMCSFSHSFSKHSSLHFHCILNEPFVSVYFIRVDYVLQKFQSPKYLSNWRL